MDFSVISTRVLPGSPVEGSLYLIDGQTITCRVCGHTSANPQHIRDRFCPNCLIFFEDLIYMERLNRALRTRFEPSGEDWQRLQAA